MNLPNDQADRLRALLSEGRDLADRVEHQELEPHSVAMDYQRWYSPALGLVAAALPERRAEFEGYYRRQEGERFASPRIADILGSPPRSEKTRPGLAQLFDPAAPRLNFLHLLNMQLAILASAEGMPADQRSEPSELRPEPGEVSATDNRPHLPSDRRQQNERRSDREMPTIQRPQPSVPSDRAAEPQAPSDQAPEPSVPRDRAAGPSDRAAEPSVPGDQAPEPSVPRDQKTRLTAPSGVWRPPSMTGDAPPAPSVAGRSRRSTRELRRELLRAELASAEDLSALGEQRAAAALAGIAVNHYLAALAERKGVRIERRSGVDELARRLRKAGRLKRRRYRRVRRFAACAELWRIPRRRPPSRKQVHRLIAQARKIVRAG